MGGRILMTLLWGPVLPTKIPFLLSKSTISAVFIVAGSFPIGSINSTPRNKPQPLTSEINSYFPASFISSW
ncbi:uncharacterized protein METZ01_LOCUS330076, partial [marine metagenome]